MVLNAQNFNEQLLELLRVVSGGEAVQGEESPLAAIAGAVLRGSAGDAGVFYDAGPEGRLHDLRLYRRIAYEDD